MSCIGMHWVHPGGDLLAHLHLSSHSLSGLPTPPPTQFPVFVECSPAPKKNCFGAAQKCPYTYHQSVNTVQGSLLQNPQRSPVGHT